MGIRIHVVLGYGLTDVQCDDFDIDDPRFNTLSYLFAERNEEDVDRFWNAEGFLKFCRTLPNGERPFTYMEALQKLQPNSQTHTWTPNESIVYNFEYGMKGVFLLVPPGAWHWQRYDDIIDYTFATQIDDNLTNNVKEVPWGVWPWNNSFMNKTNPSKRIDSQYVRAINHIRDQWKKGCKDDELYHIDTLLRSYWAAEKLSKRIGFRGYFDAIDNVRPRIPEDIVALCKYLLIFEEEETIYDLRPLLYTWWG